MHPIELSLIVAMTHERVIGCDGHLPWGRLPSDMFRFKKVTTEAGIVIMGRKTWESIPEKFRPLPGRMNLVLTRKPMPIVNPTFVRFVTSVQSAYTEIVKYGNKACVIGGEEIYKLFLPVSYLKKVHITKIHTSLPGDTFFPELDSSWVQTMETALCRWHPQDSHETSYHLFERP